MICFDGEKVNELIEKSGYKKGFIVNKLDTSWNTFGRWLKGETDIPFIKAAELADLLNCDVNEFILRK